MNILTLRRRHIQFHADDWDDDEEDADDAADDDAADYDADDDDMIMMMRRMMLLTRMQRAADGVSPLVTNQAFDFPHCRRLKTALNLEITKSVGLLDIQGDFFHWFPPLKS